MADIKGRTIAATYGKLLYTSTDDGLVGNTGSTTSVITTDDMDGTSTASCLNLGIDRVGIGTDAPAEPLHIISSAGDQLRLGYDATYYWDIRVGGNPGDLFFRDNSDTTRVTFKDAGNVGIGVVDPDYKLEIKGAANNALKITDSSGNDNCFLRPNSGQTGGELQLLNTAGVAKVFLSSTGDSAILTGNVGIGTASPDGALEVARDGANTQMIISSYDDSNSYYPYLILRKADGTESDPDLVHDNDILGVIAFKGSDNDADDVFLSGAEIIARVNGTPTDGQMPCDLEFHTNTGGTGTTQRMTILEGGNVGIGTASPMNKLQVQHAKADGDNGMMIVVTEPNVGDGDLLGGIGFDSTDGAVPSSILEASAYIAAYADGTHSATNKGGHLAFGVAVDGKDENVAATERMRIQEDGHVGIGTDSPGTKHKFVTPLGTSAVDNWVLELQHTSNTDGNCLGLNIDFTAADPNNSDQKFIHCEDSATSTHFAVLSNGNVSIGEAAFSSGARCLGLLNGTDPGETTANTACLLSLSGEMNYTDAAGNIATLDSLSDERAKDNITVIPDALSRIANVKGVTFNYVSYEDSTLPYKNSISDDVTFSSHDKYGSNTRVGVIAQDVETAYAGLNITNSVLENNVESPNIDNEDGHVQEIYGKIKKVRVETLVPLLIEAVKELSVKVTALENA